ncbi:MAG: hypothetical protein ACREWG_16160 [Gammaproteobacteria bacterium]
MGTCKFCGKPAGLLRSKHAECDQQFERGKEEILAAISQAATGAGAVDGLPARITTIAQRSFVPDSEQRGLIVRGWAGTVDKFLEDGVLDESEEKRLMELKERFSLSQAELDASGALTRVTKAAVLRDVLNGVIPQRMTVSDGLPINLQKGEQVVWVFPSSDYLEDKTRRQYVGGSQGVSIRVMKGVYYRVGAFKGEAIDRTVRVLIDTGLVAVTNKHIYFVGSAKSTRLPYAKIVSFQPFNDGVGVIRDASSAKPQIFVTGDGWFTYNLVTNLAKM